MQKTDVTENSKLIKSPFTRQDVDGYFKALQNSQDDILIDDIVLGLAKNEEYYTKYLQANLKLNYQQYLNKLADPKYVNKTKNYLHTIIDSFDYDNHAIEVLARGYLKTMLVHKLNRPGEKVWFCKYFGNKKAHELDLKVAIEANSLINYVENANFAFNKKLSLQNITKNVAMALGTRGVHINKKGVSQIIVNIDRTPHASIMPFLQSEASVLGILEIVYHELQHSVQAQSLETYNKTTYNQFKERMIISENYNYYLRHHDLFDIEREASEVAITFLKETVSDPLFDDYRATYNNLYSNKLRYYQTSKLNGANQPLLTYFDQLISHNPDITNYAWPVLKMEYNSDGQRRTLTSYMDKASYYYALYAERCAHEYERGTSSQDTAQLRADQMLDVYYDLMFKIINETTEEDFVEQLNSIPDYCCNDMLKAINSGKIDILAKRRTNLEVHNNDKEFVKVDNKLCLDYDRALNYEHILLEQKEKRK